MNGEINKIQCRHWYKKCGHNKDISTSYLSPIAQVTLDRHFLNSVVKKENHKMSDITKYSLLFLSFIFAVSCNLVTGIYHVDVKNEISLKFSPVRINL